MSIEICNPELDPELCEHVINGGCCPRLDEVMPMLVCEYLQTTPEDKWTTGNVVCRFCGHEWVAVLDPGTPIHKLECPECEGIYGSLIK